MRAYSKGGLVIGIDEVGRGALAGPLTVAAVALPDNPEIIGLDDSKKISPKRRELIAGEIQKHAIGLGICHVQPDQVDAAGMSASLKYAMTHALSGCLNSLPATCETSLDAVLIDGNPMHIHPDEHCIVKGDGKIACIAAASIYAKVTRDALMVEYAERYPAFGFDSNKGYGSKSHIAAIRKEGPSSIHRLSFLGNILSEQQSLL